MKVSNGMLAEVNSHDFDCVRWLTGSDLRRVYAETINVKGSTRGVDAKNFYDNAVVAVRFESNAVGTIDGTCPADYGYDARVELVGTEGLLIIGDVRGQAILQIQDRDTGMVTPVHRTWPDRFAEGYRAEMRAFVESILTGSDLQAGGEDGYLALCAVIAANRSWLEERPVLLDEVVAK
jgi:myo-inositol 2-dehydrogenase/D-chiro-inositol 1-dehydrogenase/scyllo-inositol 2-dehydrogenase (NAD+)